MYCVKCGVELADSEKKCPLCGTVVYHPDIVRPAAEPPYPTYEKPVETINPKGMLFIISVLFTTVAAICLFCEWNLDGKIFWSGLVTGAIMLLYIVVILPNWFRRPNPAIFVPTAFAAAAVYLFYINFSLGQNWFFTFALPITAGAALITTAIAVLSYYLRRGYLYIWSGASILTGIYTIGIEILINITFHVRNTLLWSPYPFITLFMIGLMLLVIAIVKPIRESLHKKFFI
jgi:hypothetical protein